LVSKKPGSVVRKRIEPVVFREWLRSGRQTRVTKALIKFASQFHGSPKEIVEDVILRLDSFDAVEVSDAVLKKLYAKRSADDIVRTKTILKGDADAFKKHGIAGCLDECLVLCTVLRIHGVPAKFTRILDHSQVVFWNGSRWWLADPFWDIVRALSVNELAKHQSKMSAKRKTYAEGLDAWDIGIHSINDFFKYGRAGPSA